MQNAVNAKFLIMAHFYDKSQCTYNYDIIVDLFQLDMALKSLAIFIIQLYMWLVFSKETEVYYMHEINSVRIIIYI